MAPAPHYRRMAKFVSAQELRKLLSAAGTLRRLADESPLPDDQALYRLAAEALEKRAKFLSGTLPGEDPAPERTAPAHRPVNLVV